MPSVCTAAGPIASGRGEPRLLRAPSSAAERGAHSCQKLGARERLAHKAYPSRLERRSAERRIVARGNEDRRYPDVRRAYAQLQIESRHSRHVHIENRTLGQSFFQGSEKILSARERGDLIVRQAQDAPKRRSHRQLVVHYGNQGIGAGHFETIQPRGVAGSYALVQVRATRL